MNRPAARRFAHGLVAARIDVECDSGGFAEEMAELDDDDQDRVMRELQALAEYHGKRSGP